MNNMGLVEHGSWRRLVWGAAGLSGVLPACLGCCRLVWGAAGVINPLVWPGIGAGGGLYVGIMESLSHPGGRGGGLKC